MTRSITIRESEYSDRDRALLLKSWDEEHANRGPHGVLLSEATDRENHGKFVAEPLVDYAQHAIDQARDDRRKSMANPDDDYPLLWQVRRAED